MTVRSGQTERPRERAQSPGGRKTVWAARVSLAMDGEDEWWNSCHEGRLDASAAGGGPKSGSRLLCCRWAREGVHPAEIDGESKQEVGRQGAGKEEEGEEGRPHRDGAPKHTGDGPNGQGAAAL